MTSPLGKANGEMALEPSPALLPHPGGVVGDTEAESPPLLPGDTEATTHVYRTHHSRWYILAVFSFFSFNQAHTIHYTLTIRSLYAHYSLTIRSVLGRQCLLWFTFSSIKKDKVNTHCSVLLISSLKPHPTP